MSPEALWKRYAATWSMAAPLRDDELAACLVDGATYCDPNGPIAGCAALSTYMAAFQESAPGASFQVREVHAHNGRSLAIWSLVGADGMPMQNGTSFARHDGDGRFIEISGFFPVT